MPTECGRDQLLRLMAGDGQLVEVLPRDEYEEEHLPGALNLPLKSLDRASSSILDQTRAVIVYCWDTT